MYALDATPIKFSCFPQEKVIIMVDPYNGYFSVLVYCDKIKNPKKIAYKKIIIR